MGGYGRRLLKELLVGGAEQEEEEHEQQLRLSLDKVGGGSFLDKLTRFERTLFVLFAVFS